MSRPGVRARNCRVAVGRGDLHGKYSKGCLCVFAKCVLVVRIFDRLRA